MRRDRDIPTRRLSPQAMVLTLVVIVLGAGWALRDRTDGDADVPTPASTVTDGVLLLGPVDVALADGATLLLGLAVDVAPDATSTGIDPATLLELAGARMGELTSDELSTPSQREQARTMLRDAFAGSSGGQATDVYLTRFVIERR